MKYELSKELKEITGWSDGMIPFDKFSALKRFIVAIKKEAIQELLEQHKQDRAKVSSKSDLINMSTVEKYLNSLK